MPIIKSLFLAANPIDTERLSLDREVREISSKIRASEFRDSIELISVWAVRPDDLIQSLNEYKPQIVHFSGHGSSIGEIVLVDEFDNVKPIAPNTLRTLFATLKDNIRVVILNACYSKIQAEAITEVIDCAIGMSMAITDDAAIAFVASFYRALGFGRSVQESFDQGKAALLLTGLPEENIPELLVRPGVDATKIILIHGKEATENTVSNRPKKVSKPWWLNISVSYLVLGIALILGVVTSKYWLPFITGANPTPPSTPSATPGDTRAPTGIAFDCTTFAGRYETECKALVALYNSTDGPNWIRKPHWPKSGSSLCTPEWSDVKCGEDGYVTEITLGDNSLRGELPQGLDKLTGLQVLFLEDNELTGPIPSDLTGLSKLLRLRLDGNQLTGTIPSDLDGLTELEELYLNDNQLTGEIPSSLTKLGNLRVLNLRKNQLTGTIPLEVGNLKSLIELYLNSNCLTGEIPPSFADLDESIKLDISDNDLSVTVPKVRAFVDKKDPDWETKNRC